MNLPPYVIQSPLMDSPHANQTFVDLIPPSPPLINTPIANQTLRYPPSIDETPISQPPINETLVVLPTASQTLIDPLAVNQTLLETSFANETQMNPPLPSSQISMNLLPASETQTDTLIDSFTSDTPSVSEVLVEKSPTFNTTLASSLVSQSPMDLDLECDSSESLEPVTVGEKFLDRPPAKQASVDSVAGGKKILDFSVCASSSKPLTDSQSSATSSASTTSPEPRPGCQTSGNLCPTTQTPVDETSNNHPMVSLLKEASGSQEGNNEANPEGDSTTSKKGSPVYLIVYHTPASKTPVVYVAGNVKAPSTTATLSKRKSERLTGKEDCLPSKRASKEKATPVTAGRLIRKSFGSKKALYNDKAYTCKNLYRCNICELSFPEMHLLERHFNKHSGYKLYKCDVCLLTFPKLRMLVNHSSTHTDDKLYKCDVCPLVFKQQDTMVTHRESHDAAESRGRKTARFNRCSKCLKTFMQKSELKEHRKVHQDTSECFVCLKVFAENRNLVEHFKIHLKDQVNSSYKCDICLKVFLQKTKLDSHQLEHNDEQSPYKCDNCSNRFVSTADLTKHQAIHALQMRKRFKCSYCMESFDFRKELMAHAAVHSSKTPFRCFCKKAFSTKSNLVKHLQVHTGIAPYKCGACFKVFAQETQLKMHVKAAHAEPNQATFAITKRRTNARTVQLRKRRVKEEITDEESVSEKEEEVEESHTECYLCQASFANQSKLMSHILEVHAVATPRRLPVSEPPKAARYDAKIKNSKASASVKEMSKATISRGKRHLTECAANKHASNHMEDHVYSDKKRKRDTAVKVGIHKSSYVNEDWSFYDGDDIHKCHLCNRCFCGKDAFNFHAKGHSDEGEKPFHCEHCPRAFCFRIALDTHAKTHNIPEDKSFKCDVCSKAFDDESRRDAHSKLHLRNHTMHMCNTCNELFHTADKITRHYKAVSKTKSYRCEYCVVMLENHASYVEHLENHAESTLNMFEKQYKCGICTTVVSSQKDILQHLQTVHDQFDHNTKYEVRFACDVCSQMLSSVKSMSRHMRTVHAEKKGSKKKKISEKKVVSEKNRSEKKSVLVKSVSKKKLVSEKKVTSKKKDAPDKTVVSKKSISEKTVDEFGQKFYQCEICDRIMGYKKTLARHMRKLHPDKIAPVKKVVQARHCEICGCTFSNKSNLNKHKRTVHKNGRFGVECQ